MKTSKFESKTLTSHVLLEVYALNEEALKLFLKEWKNFIENDIPERLGYEEEVIMAGPVYIRDLAHG